MWGQEALKGAPPPQKPPCILYADAVNGVPLAGGPFTVVTSKAERRRAGQSARLREGQNQVSTSKLMLAEPIEKAAVVIVKPEGTEGSELISS